VRLAGRIAVGVLLATVVPIVALRFVDPPTTAFMIRYRVASLFENSPPLAHEWVDWDGISPSAKLAVIASEDQKFTTHRGFDVDSIREAWRQSEKGRRLRGASTISQQLAKNLFLWPGRSWLRKGLETWLTVWIEALWPKRRILEVYLNVVEFGPGVFGVGAAAEHFFERPASRLTRGQAALLAAVLPNPRRFRVDRPSGYVRARAAWIEIQMRRLGPATLDGL
jgi:monofunctional biosynthetic peptidoglycan transglycosylase